MQFCSTCGGPLSWRIPPGDDRHRFVCERCGAVHYQNPKMVVGTIPEWQGAVLLCRRAIEPRRGLWTLPAGFMELDETTTEGAARESLEEAGARVQVQGLFTLFNLPHINQVYLMYRARLLDTDFAPGEESLEVGLFEEGNIPWDALAFPTIHHTLRLYFEDRRSGDFRLHTGDIVRSPGAPIHTARLRG
jgi:ADP-ribose pyrophosphatase YjhB (NUDIX family)